MRSLPHGHVAAALGTLGKIGLDHILSQGGRQPAREVALCIATMVARLVDPASKLATARLLDGETACCSPGAAPGACWVDEQALYDVLDWLLAQQERIEKALAHAIRRTARWCSMTSPRLISEGRTCPLARFGHNRDGKSGKLQIVFGLLCSTGRLPGRGRSVRRQCGWDPSTLASQIAKLKERFASNAWCWSAIAA